MATKRKSDSEAGRVKEPNFEKSLARLEKIVEEMEMGSLGLDKLMAHFEEGQTLVKFCTKKLNEVEKKIEQLVDKDGDLHTEPFDASDAENERDEEQDEEDDDLF